MTVTIFHADCIDALKTLPDNFVDSIVTDPPYGLSDHKPEDVVKCLTAWLNDEPYTHGKKGFMGKSWDSFVPGPEIWKEALRVLKPGGHLLCFAGTRSMDLMSMAIRLAGFELRDSIGFAHDSGSAPISAWICGSGMPKGLNISKQIDKKLGKERKVIGVDETRLRPNRKYESGAIGNLGGNGNISDRTDNGATITAPALDEAKQWEGWNSSLKPAWEPIVMARKPLIGTIVDNVLEYGVGGLNIDACRIPIDPELDDPRLGGKGTWGTGKMAKNVYAGGYSGEEVGSSALGRFPANVIHDGSDEVLAAFDAYGVKTSGTAGVRQKEHETHSMSGRMNKTGEKEVGYADTGSASRFFYAAKASAKDRQGSKHPTIKNLSLMRYLVKLVTPKGGTVLDPFAGSGTTGQAAVEEGCNVILMEREDEYVADIQHRLNLFLDGNPISLAHGDRSL